MAEPSIRRPAAAALSESSRRPPDPRRRSGWARSCSAGACPSEPASRSSWRVIRRWSGLPIESISRRAPSSSRPSRFGANRQRLAAWGLEGRVGQLNRRAAQLAREAREVSGREALVGGSVGPLGPPTRGLPDIPEPAARATFREQIEGLLEGGADVIVLETFSDLGQLVLAVDEARRASDVPVIASLTFGEELVLADGSSPRRPAEALWPRPVPTRSGSTAARARRPASMPSRRWAARPRASRRARSCPTPGCRSGSRGASCTPPAPSISGR